MGKPERGSPNQPPKGAVGWLGRHVDGWQAGAATLVLAASGVFLAIPRAAEPMVPPPPTIDPGALAATMAEDDARAARAARASLDVDIRAVGRELRAYNAAMVHGTRVEARVARQRTVEATRQALGRSPEELLALRAYQTLSFVGELRRWQQTGRRTTELDELGGDFLELVTRNRWCTGADRRLLPDERVLRVFYKKRWNDVTGADAGPFALSLDEERTRFAFLLRYPLLRPGDAVAETALDQARLEAYRQGARLELVARLASRDPSYPADFARGAILYRLGQFGAAAEAFRRHLHQRPDGPYALRAQNHLKATLDRTREGLF